MAFNDPAAARGAKSVDRVPARRGTRATLLALSVLGTLGVLGLPLTGCHSPATDTAGQVAPTIEPETDKAAPDLGAAGEQVSAGSEATTGSSKAQVPAVRRTPVAAPVATMRAGRTTAVFKTPGKEGVKIANLRAMIPHHEVFAVEEFLDLPGCKAPGWAKLGPDAYACLYKSEPTDEKPRLLEEIRRADLLPFVYAKPKPPVVDGVAQSIPRWRSRAALESGEPATETFPSTGSFAFVRRQGFGAEAVWIDDAGRAVKGEHLRAFKPSAFAGRRLDQRRMPAGVKGLAWSYVRDVEVFAAPDDSLEPFATLPYHSELYWHGDVGLPQEELAAATPTTTPATPTTPEAEVAAEPQESGDDEDSAADSAKAKSAKAKSKRGKKGKDRERIDQWLEIETVQVDGETGHVETIRGFVAAKKVRRWSAPTAPAELPAGEVWVDVNLSQQVLTLGVGDKLLLATLISSGKGGKYGTPTGLFRIRMKKAWGKMESLEGAEEQYYVEAVPYAQYFYKRFALHGSYWHDNFGRRTSHGCVNLSPSDAGFVYSMTTPRALGGWITAVEAPGDPGTLVRIHRNNAPVTDRRTPVGGEDAEMLADAEGEGALSEP